MGQGDFLCFIHIERAGGTTLHRILLESFPSYLSLWAWHYWTNDPMNVMRKRELHILLRVLPLTKGVGGHLLRAYLDYEHVVGKRVHYFTFIRNPITRYLSHFNTQQKNTRLKRTFTEFLDESRFNNLQTTRIADKPDLVAAIDILQNKFVFVGLTESFDESLVLMRHILDEPRMRLTYQLLNRSGAGHEVTKFADLTIEHKRRLLDNNQIDLQLYDYVSKHLYPKQREKYPGDLTRDTLQLLKHNDESPQFRTWWISPLRPFRTVYQLATKIAVEPIVHRVSGHLWG